MGTSLTGLLTQSTSKDWQSSAVACQEALAAHDICAGVDDGLRRTASPPPSPCVSPENQYTPPQMHVTVRGASEHNLQDIALKSAMGHVKLADCPLFHGPEYTG